MSVQDGPSPIVICGPSGVGKSVLIKKLQEVFPGKFGFSVSHTTRGPRPGEQDGKDYHFSDLETMKKAVADGQFVEHAEVHGNMYGTSKEAVEAVRRENKVCILDVDVQGAKSISEQRAWDKTKFTFVLPPSKDELERRLRGRGTETEDKILKRLAAATGEIDFSERVTFFDHRFVLDGLQGNNVPKEVIELFSLLQEWYPSLGGLPVQLGVLKEFLATDGAGKGGIARRSLVRVLQELDPSFTEAQVQGLMDQAGLSETDGGVDYQAFLAYVFA